MAKIDHRAKCTIHSRHGEWAPTVYSQKQIKEPGGGRSDQFSLAVVAYELHSPRASTCPVPGILLRPAGPWHMRPTPLYHRIDVALGRGMAAQPENRFASCTDRFSALDAALHATAPGVGCEAMAGPRHGGLRRLTTLLAVLLVLALGWRGGLHAIFRASGTRKPSLPWRYPVAGTGSGRPLRPVPDGRQGPARPLQADTRDSTPFS